ncbi:MAG: PocR ligand-binding domain-containing protein [Desulfobacteraceae bacterium]|nr:PocR ligand-binding domain-containing protein [Desulfobacteraceae bacterium]
MIDQEKTKEQLIEELLQLRRRVAELEGEAERNIGVEEQPSRIHRYLVDGKYGIRDLVDIDALRRVLQAFSKATGFTTGLVDYPMQKVLIATGWREICAKFHRAYPDSMRRCKKSNALLTEQLQSQKRSSINECENGLMDGATPIIIKGIHIASIKTGQVFFQRPHMEYFRNQAEMFGYDPEEYINALNAVPVVSEGQFRDALSFLSELATMIVELGMNNLEIRGTLNELEEEISERKRTEFALNNSREELKHLSSRLLIAQEEERKRIAGELHDSLGSHLTAVTFALQTARKRLSRGVSDPSCLDNPIAEVKSIIEEVRGIWMALRPTILDNVGLLPALDWYLDQYANNYPEIGVAREFQIDEINIPEQLKIVLFRIVQEAFNNIAKHSQAKSAQIHMKWTDSGIELTIKDNGVGFDMAALQPSAGEERGIGLTSMRERAELSGGVFAFKSIPGRGTTLRTYWPL